MGKRGERGEKTVVLLMPLRATKLLNVQREQKRRGLFVYAENELDPKSEEGIDAQTSTRLDCNTESRVLAVTEGCHGFES